MPTNIPVKQTNPGQPDGQLSAAEFNTLNALVNANEQAAANAGNAATAAANAASAASSTATNAQNTANAAAATATAASNTAATASSVATAAQAAADALAPAVAANTAKIGIPTATPPGGIPFNDGDTPNNISIIPVVNAYLASPADDALITAIASAVWSNNVATISNWAAGRKYKDASYTYEAFSDDTVTRVSLTGGGGGGGVTNLSATATPAGVDLASSSGSGATIPLADATNAGAMPPAQYSKVAAAIPVSVSGVQPGDLFQYDDVSQGLIRVPYDAQPDAVTAFNLNSVVGSVYGYTNPCTAGSYTIANAKARGTAIARIQNSTASGPSFSLSGGTVVKQGDWAAGWDTSGVNHVQLLAVTDTLVWAYIIA